MGAAQPLILQRWRSGVTANRVVHISLIPRVTCFYLSVVHNRSTRAMMRDTPRGAGLLLSNVRHASWKVPHQTMTHRGGDAKRRRSGSRVSRKRVFFLYSRVPLPLVPTESLDDSFVP